MPDETLNQVQNNISLVKHDITRDISTEESRKEYPILL